MSKFIFKMQNFLNVKEKLEEQKKIDYGNAVSKLEKEQQILKNLKQQKQELIKNIKNNIKNQVYFDQLQNINNYIVFIDKQIYEQKQSLNDAYKQVEQARNNLVEAVKDTKTLQSLKDNEREKYFFLEGQKEQKNVDELVSYKYNKKT